MAQYTVHPIDETIAHQVRGTLTDPIYGYGVQINETPPNGYGPCRSCLNTFTPGERRLLFLYNPFSPTQQEADFAGPIYIHEQACAAYAAGGVFPRPIAGLPLTFKGYDARGHLVAEARPDSHEIEAAIDALFARPEVAIIHVRNTEAKCFIMRIERGGMPLP